MLLTQQISSTASGPQDSHLWFIVTVCLLSWSTVVTTSQCSHKHMKSILSAILARSWYSAACLFHLTATLSSMQTVCKLQCPPVFWSDSPSIPFFTKESISMIPWLNSLGETNRLYQHRGFICIQLCFQPLDCPEGGRWYSCWHLTEFRFSGSSIKNTLLLFFIMHRFLIQLFLQFQLVSLSI